jgi:hypothetical protein
MNRYFAEQGNLESWFIGGIKIMPQSKEALNS